MINAKNFDSNKIKIDKSFPFIPLDIQQSTTLLNLLYLIMNKINLYIEESNAHIYLTLVTTDKREGTIKKHEELWNKNRGLMRLITDNSDDNNEKYIENKFNSDDELTLKKARTL